MANPQAMDSVQKAMTGGFILFMAFQPAALQLHYLASLAAGAVSSSSGSGVSCLGMSLRRTCPFPFAAASSADSQPRGARHAGSASEAGAEAVGRGRAGPRCIPAGPAGSRSRGGGCQEAGAAGAARRCPAPPARHGSGLPGPAEQIELCYPCIGNTIATIGSSIDRASRPAPQGRDPFPGITRGPLLFLRLAPSNVYAEP